MWFSSNTDGISTLRSDYRIFVLSGERFLRTFCARLLALVHGIKLIAADGLDLNDICSSFDTVAPMCELVNPGNALEGTLLVVHWAVHLFLVLGSSYYHRLPQPKALISSSLWLAFGCISRSGDIHVYGWVLLLGYSSNFRNTPVYDSGPMTKASFFSIRRPFLILGPYDWCLLFI